jgi:cytochrome P450
MKAERKPGFQFNPLCPDFTRDPHSVYAWFRENQPCARVEAFQAYLLTRYDDVKLATSDPRFTTDKRVWEGFTPFSESTAPNRDFVVEASPLVAEGDMHRAARRILPKTFSPRAIEASEAMIRQVVDDYFKPLEQAAQQPGTTIDLVELVQPIPNSVMARLLCIDEIDVKEADFISLARDFLKCINPFLDEVELARADKAAAVVIEMFRELIAMRRKQPGEDIVSRLLAAAEDDEQEVTEDGILALLSTIMIVGSDTTVYQVLLILKNLLEQPELIVALRNQPEKMEQIYTELLRVDSVGKILLRYTREDIELHGVKVSKGAMVFLPAAAANRDPRMFADPDQVNIDRDLSDSMHFGHGIHYCLGAHLAKAEIRAILEKFSGCMPADFKFDPEKVTWRSDNFSVREIMSLPVTMG